MLLPQNKSAVIHTVREKKLESYFYHKSQPNFEISIFLSWVFLITGFLISIFGLVAVINNYFSIGIGTKYLVPIIRGGAFDLILGLILFGGGLIRLSYEIKRGKFIKSLTVLLKKS